jgi:hypothetical protein
VPKKTKEERSANAKRVANKIAPASELEDPFRLLIYGRSKVGKTRLASTAPNVLMLDINEKGTKSTRRDTNPDVLPIDRWDEITDAYWYLKEGDHGYDSVALDGLTAMQTLAMNHVLGEATALDASRDPDMPSRPLWGKTSQLMKKQITNYRNLPMNVIFTALTRVNRDDEEDDDDLSTTTIGPAVSPAVSGHAQAAVDVIGYLYKREVWVKSKKSKEKKKKVIRTRLVIDGSEKYDVGDRLHVFGTHIDAPNITEMLEQLNQGGTEVDG